MKIRVMTVCKNEERIMPFFIKHYEPWVDEILIIDGGSTDASLKIANELGNGKVKSRQAPYDDGKYINDIILRKIRNEEWKEGCQNFDWTIVCDNDELLYHPNILEKLAEYKSAGVTIPKIQGYQMISKSFPDPTLKITDQIQKGTLSTTYTKNIIFDSKKISNMQYCCGSHKCFPTGKISYSDKAELKLLHYRMLSYDYYIDKAGFAAKNLDPELLKTRGYGKHNFEIINKCTLETYTKEYNSAVQVI